MLALCHIYLESTLNSLNQVEGDFLLTYQFTISAVTADPAQADRKSIAPSSPHSRTQATKIALARTSGTMQQDLLQRVKEQSFHTMQRDPSGLPLLRIPARAAGGAARQCPATCQHSSAFGWLMGPGTGSREWRPLGSCGGQKSENKVSAGPASSGCSGTTYAWVEILFSESSAQPENLILIEEEEFCKENVSTKKLKRERKEKQLCFFPLQPIQTHTHQAKMPKYHPLRIEEFKTTSGLTWTDNQ
nr:uncharacterized protein LOC129464643 [Symphalangus syndactylus]